MTEPIATQFPHESLTPLAAEQPTHATLKLLHKELNANAISIPSLRGNGILGHLAITIPANAYIVASGGVEFVPPAHPGAQPVHPAQPTQHQITEINRQFAADLKEFHTFTSVAANLKKQIIQAVPATYINELSDETLGFANVTVLNLLQHLDTNYGTITADDLSINLKHLHREWTGAQPLEDLWQQIRLCRVFAADIDPISEATAIRAALDNLENTGLFTDAIKDWRKRPDLEHTLANFKADFTKADTERKRHLTSKTAGYHGAALAVPSSTKPDANVNTATTNASQYYCWSHGLGPNPSHTSQTCTKRAPSHCPDATATNMLGGNNTIRRRRGETAIFRSQPRQPKDNTPSA
jgi:hypothetical protein